MEKNTLLAVVLSVVVLVLFSFVQGIFFSPPAQQASSQAEGQSPSATGQVQPVGPLPGTDSASVADGTTVIAAADEAQIVPGVDFDSGPENEELVNIETDFLSVTLSNAGGNVSSFKLNRHKDGDDPVEMIFSGTSGARAFTTAFGGPSAVPENSLFNVERPSTNKVIFSRDFMQPDGTVFRLEKEYEFFEGEYMFQLTVRMDGVKPGFDFGDNAAYTLSFGPQLGPAFARLDNRQNFRQYFTFNGKKRETKQANDSRISTRPQWAAITGQYFTFIAIPSLPGGFDLSFSQRPEPGVPAASRLHIIRPPLSSSRTDDVYRFYLGPRTTNVLQAYNTGASPGFGSTFAGMQLTEMAEGGFLAPLENVLKWLLNFFYGLIPNYGVAIILLTLLVKLAFFPLTRKSSEATLRMQVIAPKIKELQEKYKDNRQKLNMEMAELYKREGYNPLKGCLPLLLQFPIFIAMYNLFRSHFELRGASFIEGWIPDLSVPEHIWLFPDGATLPILGWDALRLLPFIYVGSQLLYGKVTQTPDQKANPQMKLILYVMPIVFFFVLYNMPSGLLVYWTSSNVLTMIQQLIIMRFLARKKAEEAAKTPVIAPQHKNGKTGNGKPAVTIPKKRKKR